MFDYLISAFKLSRVAPMISWHFPSYFNSLLLIIFVIMDSIFIVYLVILSNSSTQSELNNYKRKYVKF